MCKVKSITVNNDIDYKWPWAPTKENPYGDPEGYILRGQSVWITWERCNENQS